MKELCTRRMVAMQNILLVMYSESSHKGVTETLIKRTAKMEYEYFFESEYGMETGFVEAINRRELLAKMKAQFPDDIGSDGFAVDPDGNDFPLNW